MPFLLFFLLCMNLSLPVFSLEKENIPHFEEEALHVLPFSIQKEFSDGSLSTRFLKELQDCFQIDVFIETGTHLGNTTQKASEIFTTVHTVELFPEYYSLAMERFKNSSNVHVYFGNSGEVLSAILPACQQKTLFYLDGHYDGGQRSGKGEKNTPILEELAAIKSWGRADAVIVIDDICDFQESIYPNRILRTCFENYPSLRRVVDQILEINPDYQICFIPNALLIFPPSAEVTVSPLLSACSIDYLSTISNLFSERELLEAEKTIACVQGAERMELEKYFQAYSNFEWNYGWRSFASFWMGLILLQEQNRAGADQIFKLTAQHSIPGWRIDDYVQILSLF